ncbi:MAG TPA: cysteine methyltransferase, partial [Acidovorax temperans]|nr:cysteine methyltransferase [Acidovorax temperans]
MREPSLRPSPALGHALFDTAVGRCALAWGEAGLRAVQLPEQDDAATVARLL